MKIETVKDYLYCYVKLILLRVVLIIVYVPVTDLPQVIEHPMDMRGKRNVHGVGTSTGNHVEKQVDIGSEVLPPEIQANYDLWSLYTLSKEFPRFPSKEVKRVFNENNNRFAPSYMAISPIYTAALAAEQNGMAFRLWLQFDHIRFSKM